MSACFIQKENAEPVHIMNFVIPEKGNETGNKCF